MDATRLRFTKTALQALPSPPPGERATYYDVEIPKLALRVSPKGRKTFYVIKRASDEMVWAKLGSFPDMTVEQARNAAQSVLGEFAKGNNPSAIKRALRKEPTFGEVLEQYLVEKRKRDGSPLTERTRAEYRKTAERYLTALLPLKLSAISHERVAHLHAVVGQDAPIAANRAKALVSSIFNHARRQRIYVGENPAEGIRGYAEIERDRFANSNELPSLFAAISVSPQRDYFLLALLTGARRSNLQAMAWRDIDTKNALWRIGQTKNGTPQQVHLSPEVIAILAERKKTVSQSPYVFPGEGKTGHLVEPKNSWSTIKRWASLIRVLDALQDNGRLSKEEREDAEAAMAKNLSTAEAVYHARAVAARIDPAHYDMTDLRIHDLRRTLGSWQAMGNSSLEIIGKSLNHKSSQATQIYARLAIDPVRDSVNKATTSMLEAAGLRLPSDSRPDV